MIFLLLFTLFAHNPVNSEMVSEEFLSTYPQELIGALKSISVKRYPEPLQVTYEVFQAKCTTCHGAEDSLQAKQVLPSYWETTTRRMQAMKDSNISPDEAAAIAEFLIYDSSVRRKSLLDKQLKDLPPNEQAQEKAKLDAIRQKYGG